MNYKLINAIDKDLENIIKYKLNSIFDYAENLSQNEKLEIQNYVESNIPNQLKNYKNIVVSNNIIGCLLVEQKDDGVLLDEIYIDNEYRNKGIGTNIINNILKENKKVYLWVYKANVSAIKLYQKLGFNIIDETDTRYYMKYDK